MDNSNRDYSCVPNVGAQMPNLTKAEQSEHSQKFGTESVSYYEDTSSIAGKHMGSCSEDLNGVQVHRKLASLPYSTTGQVPKPAKTSSNFDRSPRRKQSKSESRRKREKRIISSGELEVRQANETLMRYLRQCTEINDASLSGELEIDNNYDDKKVYRQTKVQREIQGAHLEKFTSGIQFNNGFTNILHKLVDDIVPNNNEIYNPFTPVISPSDGSENKFKNIAEPTFNAYIAVNQSNQEIDTSEINTTNHRSILHNVIGLSENLYQNWKKVANLCHGFLGGIALAQLLLMFTTRSYDWLSELKDYSDLVQTYSSTFNFLTSICIVSTFDRLDLFRIRPNSHESIGVRYIIILIAYLAALILSLSMESTIKWVNNADTNGSTWQEDKENSHTIYDWNSLCIARSLSSVVGWIMIGITSDP